MLKEPTGSDKTTIKKGDKEYHWCKHHKHFVHHTNDKCQLKPKDEAPSATASCPMVQVNQALSSTAAGNKEDSNDE